MKSVVLKQVVQKIFILDQLAQKPLFLHRLVQKHLALALMLGLGSCFAFLEADVRSTTGSLEFVPQGSQVQMTLNSTGLGIEVTPQANLHVSGNGIVSSLAVGGASSSGSNLSIQGSLGLSVLRASADVSAVDHSMLLMDPDTAGANLRVNLPCPNAVQGRVVWIKNTSTSHDVIVSGQDHAIDGFDHWTLSSNTSVLGVMKLIAGVSSWCKLSDMGAVAGNVSSFSTYHLYSNSGNQFTQDGGTIEEYAMAPTTQTASSPEGADYLRLTVGAHYASYTFVMPSGDYCHWSQRSLKFKAKSSNPVFDLKILDTSGNIYTIELKNVFTHDGTWQDVSVPFASFSGLDMRLLSKIYVYRTWNDGVYTIDLDHIRIE